MISTSASAQANRRKGGQRSSQTAENGKVQYQRARIKQVLATATVNPKVAEAFRKNESLQRFATVSGNSLTPGKGLAIAKLADGRLVITNEGNTVTPYMQVITGVLSKSYLVIWICRCAGSNPDDDPCEFTKPTNPKNPGSCRGAQCCGTTLITVDADAADVHVY